jgi:SAM-dependent methyltransferase
VFNRTPRIADWTDPAMLRAAFSRLRLNEDTWTIRRKNWEWAIALRALEHYGYMEEGKTALGLGSGREALMFALADTLRMTVGTDLYGQTVFAGNEADASILRGPASAAPFAYDERGLLVATMDACDIAFGDSSFDIVFSCSSLEHFGATDRILQAQREAYRVLRRGGVYVLSVDYLFRLPDEYAGLTRDGRGPAGGLDQFFTSAEVSEIVVESAGFRLDEPIDFAVEHEPPLNAYDLESGTSSSGEMCPHLYCGFRGAYLTSLFLVLFK